jgi:cytochrome c peroxidase
MAVAGLVTVMAIAGCRMLPDAAAAGAISIDRSAAASGLSADELAAILAHGPWPVPFVPDPSNRVSGNPVAIELGRRLFSDPRLSSRGDRACVDCHRPGLGFADGRARSPGADGTPLDRNAQGLLDVRLQRWFGWDGAADSLWAFTLRPLADPRELGTDPVRLTALYAGDPMLACLRQAAFGNPPSRTTDAAMAGVQVDTAKALAAFMETLDSPRTRFDGLRDALARGDTAAASRYPADAMRGLRLFVGEGRCNLCHLGPAFTNGEFHDIGRPFMAAPGRVDPGRHRGVREVLADPHNLLGPWSDASGPQAATRTRHLAPAHRNFGEFRVPGLRSAALTAPYGHDGSMPALRDVVAHYSDLDVERLHSDGEALLRPLRLDAGRTAELLAFLATLSEPEPDGPAPLEIRRTRPKVCGIQEVSP